MRVEKSDHILIVEDDPNVATLERRCLDRAGYAVSVASTADEALRELSSEPPDLMLLDYQLPGGTDGLQFYSSLRARGYRLPVILVTGFGSENTVIEAMRAGVRDFVSKSIAYLDYLPEAIDRVLKQVHLERQLAESEARFRSLVNSVDDLIVTLDRNHRITGAYGRWLARYELNPETFVGRTIRDLAGAESAVVHEQANRRALAGEKVLYEWSLVWAGETHWFQTSLSPLQNFKGAVMGVVGVGREITERKRAEELLIEQAALLDQANDAIMVLNMDDRICFWNRGAERVYGWPAGTATGRNALELLATQSLAEHAEAAQQAITKGEWVGELRHRTRDGKEVIVASRWTLVCDPTSRPQSRLIINTDVTEKKRLEARFLRAQRMEGIGTLAGGVAHDFNNLLTVILGYTDMLLADMDSQDPSHGIVSEIHKAGERATALTRQLLAFSRKQVMTPTVLDLNVLVREIEKMLRRLIGEDVELDITLASDLDRIKADPGQIEQVILNLAVNARDAMPQGGDLLIRTANVSFDRPRDEPPLAAGDYVVLTVRDTGCGMDEATKSRIFEPFFSTKEPGQGTGLGLSTVFGIVQQSGGQIEVETALGRGTTFRVYFPAASGSISARRSGSGGFRMPSGTETLLVVEDEAQVRGLTSLALKASGYRVLEAANGPSAIAICKRHPEPIDLLVTDVVMPKMSGRELAGQLAELRPSMKVLFLSGYTNDAILRHGIQESRSPFLQKPFTPSALVQKVREVLDQ